MPDIDPVRAAVLLAAAALVAVAELAVRARLAGLPLIDLLLGGVAF